MSKARISGPRWAAAVAALLLAALSLSVAAAQAADADQVASYSERFDRAWRLVDERYWGIERTGVDWHAVGEQYRPQALAATDDDAFYAVLERMYEELGDDHSVFVPPARVAEISAAYGSMPCVALFAATPAGGALLRAWADGGLAAPGLSHAPALLVAAGQTLPRLKHRQQQANVTFGLTAEGVGYLRVPDLASDGVAGAVRRAVNTLQEQGAWSFVLDLRGNPGGRLVSMMEVAGVFTTGFLWRAITRWTIPMPYPVIGVPATDLPLAVLVDENVHSAAEGLAGALQARGRAVVFGHTSAGNVEALLPFCLRDGSQAWIATGVLAPLFGRTWEGQGVIPDVETGSAAAPKRAIAWLQEQR